MEGGNSSLYEGRIWQNNTSHQRKRTQQKKRIKEGFLFSLDGIKKVKGNLGAKEPFEEAGDIGKIG